MNVLVLNTGSASHRVSLFHSDNGWPEDPCDPVWESSLQSTAPGLAETELLWLTAKEGRELSRGTLPARTPLSERLLRLFEGLFHGQDAPFRRGGCLSWIAHRIVHGGDAFTEPVCIDRSVEEAIHRFSVFAPLHNEANLEGIRACRRYFGSSVPQFAVFDTAFHRNLPGGTAFYAGPFAWIDRGLRRYGFHGLSFAWAAGRSASLLGHRPDDPDFSLILCHLGGGCSLCAVRGGNSVDTTMGMTPLEGLAMCTRSGSVDPGLLLHLLREDPDLDRLEHTLNKESGLKGLSGLPGDTRLILKAAHEGHKRAQLAMDVFIHRLRAGMGQMFAALGRRPDAIVFTDAIGEDQPEIRAAACEAFVFLGVGLDPAKNAAALPDDSDLSLPGSPVRVLVIKSREDWQAARECHALWRQLPAALPRSIPPTRPNPNEAKERIPMPNEVYKSMELTGTSSESVEKAVAAALQRASQTIRHVRWFELLKTHGCVEDGRVKEYHVTLKIGFALEKP